MAAAAIAAKAAINRKIARQKAEQMAADLAAGLDPEEEFMKRVMKRMEEEKKAKLTKWQDPTRWTVSVIFEPPGKVFSSRHTVAAALCRVAPCVLRCTIRIA